MRRLPLALILAASPAAAEVPQVAADIAPVHALVARVMQGLGEPALILPPGASPHGYSLRPSEARALDQADAVFWIGEALTPWLDSSLETLASDAVTVELLEAEGTTTLPFRSGASFTGQVHDEDDGGEDDHEEEAHDHAGLDPHAWLDPENGKAWLGAIAATLSEIDPGNAAAYAANAAAGREEIAAAQAKMEAQLAPLQGTPFVVFHDGYQYLESRFGLPAAAAISLGDGADPSPARIREVQAAVAETGAACTLSEPQFDPGLIDTVFGGTEVRHGVIDPLGTTIPEGPGFYVALLEEVAGSLADCLTAPAEAPAD